MIFKMILGLLMRSHKIDTDNVYLLSIKTRRNGNNL